MTGPMFSLMCLDSAISLTDINSPYVKVTHKLFSHPVQQTPLAQCPATLWGLSLPHPAYFLPSLTVCSVLQPGKMNQDQIIQDSP